MLPVRRFKWGSERNGASTKRRTAVHETARKQQKFRLRLHDMNYLGGDELLVNPDFFPDLRQGDLVSISVVENDDQEPGDRPPEDMVMRISSLKPKLPAEISVLSVVADMFNLSPHMVVEVRKVSEDVARVTSIELTLKDQYISSSEMWRLKLFLVDSWLHVQKPLSMGLVKVRVKELKRGEENVLGGLILPDTTVTFRSKSENLFWLVQVSKEMWQHAGDGMLYYELLYELIQKIAETWNEAEVNHTLTLVFFARVFGRGVRRSEASTTQAFNGDQHFDAFKIVVDKVRSSEICKNTASFLRRIKKEFTSFPSLLGLSTEQTSDLASAPAFEAVPQSTEDPVNLSSAADGNTLEALNLVLNTYTGSKMDRGFPYTGTNMLLITAGKGVMKVDRQLASITRRRLVDCGLACEIISLASPPGHAVPIFIFADAEKGLTKSMSHDSGFQNADRNLENLSFTASLAAGGYGLAEPHRRAGLPLAELQHVAIPDQWLTVTFLGRVPEVRASHKPRKSAIVVPFHNPEEDRRAELKTVEDFDEYDEALFRRNGAYALGLLSETSDEKEGSEDEVLGAHAVRADMAPTKEDALRKTYSRSAEMTVSPKPGIRPSQRAFTHLWGMRDSSPTSMLTSMQTRWTAESPSQLRGADASCNMARGSAGGISRSPRANSRSRSPHGPYGSDTMKLDESADSLGLSGFSGGKSYVALARRQLEVRGLQGSFYESTTNHIHAVDPRHALPGLLEAPPEDELAIPRDWLWKTLVEPSILPLTTARGDAAYLSRANNTTRNWYVVSVPHISAGESQILSLVKEMVCQRMVMDYQVVVGASDETFMYYAKKLGDDWLGPSETRRGIWKRRRTGDTRCVLVKGDEFHELVIRSDNYAQVEVTRHVKPDGDKRGRQHYSYCLWSKPTGSFTQRTTSFEYGPEGVNWNKLDHMLVAGASGNVNEVRDNWCRKASFVVMAGRPPPGPLTGAAGKPALSDAEYCANFIKLMRMMTKSDDFAVETLDRDRPTPLPWRKGTSPRRRRLAYRVGMEPFRGEQNEWIILGCDSFVSMEYCHHLTIKWIICDGNVVLDYTQSLQRRAKQLGLTVVPVPVNLFAKSASSFETRVEREITHFQSLIVHEALLSRLDFVVKTADEDSVEYLNTKGEVLVCISDHFEGDPPKASTCIMTYTENTLPDFMEESALQIYKQIDRMLERIETVDGAIAEIVNLAVERAVADSIGAHI